MQPQPAAPAADNVVSRQAAQTIRQLLKEDDTLSFAISALAGPDSSNGWYLALTPADAPQYALVVVVEDSMNLDAVREIGVGVETE